MSEQAASRRPSPSSELNTERRAQHQVRRAWLILLLASIGFALLAAGVIWSIGFYIGHATRPETATLQVVSGDGALLRPAHEDNWRLVANTAEVHEGDMISTELGTVVWLTMFDGSSVEVSEDTVVRVARMRSSRFIQRTKNIILEPKRGTVYIGMAAHGEYSYSEFTVQRDASRITMSDEPGRSGAGAFLVEVLPADGVAELEQGPRLRVAVLRGEAAVRTAQSSFRLNEDEQAVIAEDGTVGPVTSAVRELIQNGDFAGGMAGWVEFEQQSRRTSGIVDSGASVELVGERIGETPVTAIEFLRASGQDDVMQVGVRQRVGQTLRVYSSLILQLDVKISDQGPLGGGEDHQTFPFNVKLIYIDVEGQEREWWRGYYVVEDPEAKVPLDRAARLDLGEWQHVAFDLRGLSPLPKQVTAIVVYASGQSFETRVANLSLTSSETTIPAP